MPASKFITTQELLNAWHDFDVSVPRYEAYNSTNVSTSAQTQITAVPGVLGGIILNTTLVSALRGYDNTVSGGKTLFTIPAAAAAGTFYQFKAKLSNGFVVSSGAAADNFTVLYL